MKPKQGLIFVISGPSGSGKTTLLKELLKTKGLKNRLAKSVSYTTRTKRPNEIGAKDYFFISKKDFIQKRKGKKLLEWTRYLGYHYATARDFIEGKLLKGKYPILNLDFKGALRIKKLYPENSVLIFVMPPSLETLKVRIEKRSQKTKKSEIARRMNLAKRELLNVSQYDYRVVNKDLRLAVRKLKDIILSRITA